MSTDYDFTDLDDAMAAATATTVTATEPEKASPQADPPQSVRVVRGDQSHRPPLYFDIETIPDYERMAAFGLEPLPEAKAETPLAECPYLDPLIAGTIPDVEKVLRSINPPEEWLLALAEAERGGKKPRDGVFKAIAACRAAKNAVAEAEAERRKLMATTPEFCRIVAIGSSRGAADVGSMLHGQEYETEGEMLTAFWSAAAACSQLVGYNIAAFDLPVILVRSALLGIPATRLIDLRPWGRDVCDLMALRFASRMSKPMRLKSLAKAMGIAIPAGDETDGSDVERLWRDEPDKLRQYVESDVTITRELHRMYQGYFCL